MDMPSPDMITSAVEECLKRAREHQANAAQLLYEKLITDPTLEQAAKPYLLRACAAMISDYVSRQRGEIEHAYPGSGEQLTDRDRRIRESGGFTLWALPIPGRPFLRDATIEQLEAAANEYTRMSQTYAQRAKFCHAVIDKLPLPRHRTEEKLGELWVDVQKGEIE